MSVEMWAVLNRRGISEGTEWLSGQYWPSDGTLDPPPHFVPEVKCSVLTVLWDVRSCGIIDMYRRFRGSCRFRVQGERWTERCHWLHDGRFSQPTRDVLASSPVWLLFGLWHVPRHLPVQTSLRTLSEEKTDEKSSEVQCVLHKRRR
jgi:hypothetical protein